jgi:hypothetical protein
MASPTKSTMENTADRRMFWNSRRLYCQKAFVSGSPTSGRVATRRCRLALSWKYRIASCLRSGPAHTVPKRTRRTIPARFNSAARQPAQPRSSAKRVSAMLRGMASAATMARRVHSSGPLSTVAAIEVAAATTPASIGQGKRRMTSRVRAIRVSTEGNRITTPGAGAVYDT